MKFYDKKIYVEDKKIKSALTVIIIFILGFVVGCYSMYIDRQSTIKDLQNRIEGLESQVEELKNEAK